MPTEEVTLREDRAGVWSLYAPKGHALAGPFRGSEHAALDWAKRYCSSWYNMTITVEKEIDNAKEDRLPE